MTIALGLIAADGIVIAADRQETEGYQKKSQRKIESLWALPVGALLVSGAGHGPYIDTITERLNMCFGGCYDSSDDETVMTEKFRDAHHSFYSEAVLPFITSHPDDQPDYEVLLGRTVRRQHFLWYSYKLTLNRAHGFRAVGIGAGAAESLLKKFYVSRLPLKIAISLAAFVIYEVKNSVDRCGLQTDVLFTQQGAPPCRVSPHVLREMEDAFDKFRFLERDELYKSIGGGVVPSNRNAKDWNKFRRDVIKTFDSFYSWFDAQPPYKSVSEATPSTSQKSEPEQ